MRPFLPVVLAAAMASPAAAQILPFSDLHAENRLAARQELARQQALAADREALVMETRARATTVLSGLREQRLAAGTTADAAIDPRVAADIEAVATAQARLLAESNARILAIKAASED